MRRAGDVGLLLVAAVALSACGTEAETETAQGESEEGGYVQTLGRTLRGGFADRTRGDMQAIAVALTQRLADSGDYPGGTDMERLAAELEPAYIRTMPRTDAWGRPFLYQPTGGGYTLTSYGPDGGPDGGDDLVMTESGFR